MSDTSESAIPEPIRDHLYALVERLTEADGLFVLLDFDGSLAAITDRPEDATLPERTRETIRDLRDTESASVGVVTGRELADVRDRVDVSGIEYAGNHGLELRHDGETVVHPEARDARETIAEVSGVLDDWLAAVPGAFVEEKGVTATVHYRLADDDAVPVVRRAVSEALADREAVEVTEGKSILELRPRVEWDKGRAVEWLRDQRVPDDETWVPVYVGDDRTDEDAFDAVADDGVGVKVGDRPDTNAGYRVADPQAVGDVLAWLAEYGVGFLDFDSAIPGAASP